MKSPTRGKDPDFGEQHVERVRKICLGAACRPGIKISHGEPTFFVCKRVFAMFSTNHHNDGHYAVVMPAAIGIQAALIEANPKKFYRPPYVVGAGGRYRTPARERQRLAMHLQEAWRLIAPEKLHAPWKRTSKASQKYEAREQASLRARRGASKHTFIGRSRI
jgi:hypothetical protein